MAVEKNRGPGAWAICPCVGWTLAGLSWCASAQVPDLESVQRANQRAIREAQDRPLPQVDVFIAPSALPADVPPTPDEVQSVPCLNVASIELLGHQPALGAAPVLPRTPLCLDTPGLNSLLGRLNAHYQAGGWITTRVYVDPAVHTPGVLRLRVVPGQIEQIVLGAIRPMPARTRRIRPMQISCSICAISNKGWKTSTACLHKKANSICGLAVKAALPVSRSISRKAGDIA